MQNGLAWNWTDLTRCTVSSDTLLVTPVEQRKHAWRTLYAVNTLQEPPVKCHVVMTLSVHGDSDVCGAAAEHSAGFWKSWVCLQRHATGVTSNGVTIRGSKFPPTLVSTANINTVQYQKTYQQCAIPIIPLLWYPRCCFLSSTSRQTLFTATANSYLMSIQACQIQQS